MLDFAKPMAKRYEYRAPNGDELREAARIADVDAQWLSAFLRLPLERVRRILSGAEEARHHIRIILALLALPGGVALCERVTAGITGKMTAAQFRRALDQLHLTEGRFGRLYGTTPKRVRSWVTGEEDIPHAALLALSLLTLPGAVDMAERVTDSVISDTRERD